MSLEWLHGLDNFQMILKRPKLLQLPTSTFLLVNVGAMGFTWKFEQKATNNYYNHI